MPTPEKRKAAGQTETPINGPDPRKWVSGHADYLYAYAFARVDDEEQAKDLVQETFLAALKGLGDFELKSTERTWLTAILKNKIVDYYRKKSSGLSNLLNRSDGMAETEETHDFFDPADGHWTPACQPRNFGIENDDPVLTRELHGILEKCLKRLPAFWLAIFTMKHMEDLPTDKICSDLKVSSSNFWVVIHRAKVHLRECLQRNWI